MILDISFYNILDKLGHCRVAFNETILPDRCPPVPNSPYRPGYDWLFVYERKLASFLEPWLKSYRYELIGEKGLLCEALSNAYCHGNKRNGALPIHVRVYVGTFGLLIQIQDSGTGFDVNQVLTDCANRKAYFHQAGNGTRLMVESKIFGVFYEKGGATFYMVYAFDEDLQKLSSAFS